MQTNAMTFSSNILTSRCMPSYHTQTTSLTDPFDDGQRLDVLLKSLWTCGVLCASCCLDRRALRGGSLLTSRWRLTTSVSKPSWLSGLFMTTSSLLVGSWASTSTKHCWHHAKHLAADIRHLSTNRDDIGCHRQSH